MMLAKRMIPRAGLAVSELGFGGASIGNLYRPVADVDARATIDAALDAGMTYIDTAPRYGHGLSERRIGDAVRGRDDIVLSSKVGRLFHADPALRGDAERHGFCSPLPFEQRYDYSYDGILRSHEDSLLRLGLGRIDILYIHDIGRATHGDANAAYFAQLTQGGGFRALEELRASGAIAAFGLGVNEWEVCLEAMDHADLDVVLLAGRYTLLEQEAVRMFLPACQVRSVAVVIGGAYNSGILAAGTRGPKPPHYDYGPAPEAVVQRVQRIEAICDAFEVPLAAAALQFPLAHPAVVSVIPGLDRVARVEATMALYRHTIPLAFWQAIREAGLVDPAAAIPGTTP
jgi:D-threo-aldose 1-dehydrogenase